MQHIYRFQILGHGYYWGGGGRGLFSLPQRVRYKYIEEIHRLKTETVRLNGKKKEIQLCVVFKKNHIKNKLIKKTGKK